MAYIIMCDTLLKGLFFPLHDDIEENRIGRIYLKFCNLNRFFSFYFLNSNISITIYDRDVLFQNTNLVFQNINFYI